MSRRWATRSAALALLPLLGGCVAIAALPVLAGGAMVAGGNAHVRAATPNPAAKRRSRPPRVPAVSPPVAKPPSESAGSASTVELTPAVELPVPGGASASDPWRKFVSYTLDKVREWESGGSQSALLVRGTSLASPQMRPCTASTAAVMLDLDPEDGVFGASPNAAPPPGLAEGLARLRDAGIVALWITRRPSADVAAVARALKTSGLDPEGRDPMLLVRSADDRKQTLREQANEDVCVIAIAGDRKSDFDELFDYLRDPNGAPGLDQLLGAGWFIAPPPLG